MSVTGVKRVRDDMSELVRVVVQLVGEDAVHQNYREAYLSLEELGDLRTLVHSSPNMRQDVIRTAQNVRCAQLLRKFYKYDDKCVEDPFAEDTEFPEIDVSQVSESPCYFITWFAND